MFFLKSLIIMKAEVKLDLCSKLIGRMNKFKMKKQSFIGIISIMALLSACGVKQSTSVSNSQTETNTVTNSKSVISPTTKNSNEQNDYVPSETGTEKAKPELGKANMQGKVFYNANPAANIEVRLCVEFYMNGNCDGEKHITKTDANGEYLFVNLTPKTYKMSFRVFETKNYIFSGKYGFLHAKYNIEADKTFFVPLTNLFKSDLKVQNPKPRMNVDAQNFEIKWDAYPDAAYYKLELLEYSTRTKHLDDEKVDSTGFKVEKNLNNGAYRLRIAAYNAIGVKLAQCEDGVEFTLTNGMDVNNANKKQ